VTTVLDICDELAPLLEATAANRDDSRAVPTTYVPGLLYLWPRTEVFVPDGDGSLDDEQFRLRVAWTTDAAMEQAAQLRDRATTDTIHAKAAAFATVVRGHRRGSTYESLAVASVDHEGLTSIEGRGFYMDLTGQILHA
jgi:hypothetical protein